MPPVLRSILAIIAGFIAISFVVGVLTVLTMVSLHIQPAHPTLAYLAVNVLYSLLAAVAGGLITGLIAPHHPLQHGYVLAGIMLLMGLISYLRFHGAQPAWYQILLVLAPPACAIAGAALCARSARRLPA